MNNFNYNSYYTYNNRKYLSKIKVLQDSKGDVDNIQFHWMPEVWDNVDWTNEPSQSFKELCKIRCQQIRDKYNWVAIWYSSGYDSHTILRTFVDNKILVDELLIYDRRDWFDDPEIPFAIKHAQYIKDTYYPNLKINVVRTSLESLCEFYNKQKQDWIFGPYLSLKLSKTQRHFSTTEITDFLKTFPKNKNRANVMGIDKPKLILRDNKWYAFTPDVMGETSMGDQENFYISGDLPELHLKQCHMTAHWFESLQNLTEDLVHEIQGREREKSKLHDLYYEPWNIGMGRYPLFHSHDYSINGHMKLFHSNDENSIDAINLLNYVKKHDNKVYKIYTEGLLEARLLGKEKLSKTFISKQYFIKDKT